MNQNGTQGVRQVTPEEIARVENIPLTQEEKEKTQVLNLKEFVETVRFEKLTSKKPAIVLAIIGALFITFGTTFQITKSLNHKKDAVVETRNVPVQEPIEEEETTGSILSCNKTIQNNPDGTDTNFNILYKFEEGKLVGFLKTFQATATPGNETGVATIQKYLTNYQAFLNPIEGYKIHLSTVTNGVSMTVEVDYLTLDLTQLNPQQQLHFSTKVDYPLDTAYETIETDMLNDSFICG